MLRIEYTKEQLAIKHLAVAAIKHHRSDLLPLFVTSDKTVLLDETVVNGDKQDVITNLKWYKDKLEKEFFSYWRSWVKVSVKLKLLNSIYQSLFTTPLINQITHFNCDSIDNILNSELLSVVTSMIEKMYDDEIKRSNRKFDITNCLQLSIFAFIDVVTNDAKDTLRKEAYRLVKNENWINNQEVIYSMICAVDAEVKEYKRKLDSVIYKSNSRLNAINRIAELSKIRHDLIGRVTDEEWRFIKNNCPYPITIENAKILLAKFAIHIDTPVDDNKNTLLHIAADRSDYFSIAKLLELGADPFYTNGSGNQFIDAVTANYSPECQNEFYYILLEEIDKILVSKAEKINNFPLLGDFYNIFFKEIKEKLKTYREYLKSRQADSSWSTYAMVSMSMKFNVNKMKERAAQLIKAYASLYRYNNHYNATLLKDELLELWRETKPSWNSQMHTIINRILINMNKWMAANYRQYEIELNEYIKSCALTDYSEGFMRDVESIMLESSKRIREKDILIKESMKCVYNTNSDLSNVKDELKKVKSSYESKYDDLMLELKQKKAEVETALSGLYAKHDAEIKELKKTNQSDVSEMRDEIERLKLELANRKKEAAPSQKEIKATKTDDLAEPIRTLAPSDQKLSALERSRMVWKEDKPDSYHKKGYFPKK